MSDKYLEVIRKMDLEFATYSKSSPVFEWIKEDVYLRYFMGYCESADWFLELKKRGLFAPKEVLCPIKNDDSVSIPYWPQLDYLVKVSNQIKDGADLDYAYELLCIVKNISEFKDEKGAYIDNYYVWDRFVNILLNLPNNSIHSFFQKHNVNFKAWLDAWLSSKYDKSVVSSNLATKLFSKFMPEKPSHEDIIIAEIITEQLLEVDIKPTEPEGSRFLAKHRKVQIKVDDYWVVEGLIKKMGAKRLGAYCSQEFLWNIINKTREALQYEWFDTYVDIKNSEMSYRIVVKRVEQDRQIQQGIFDVDIRQLKVQTTTDSQKVELFSDKDEVLVAGESVKSSIIKDVHDRKQFASKIVANMSDMQSLDAEQISEIEKLYSDFYSDHGYIWIKSIRVGAQYYSKEALTILTVCLRDLLHAKGETEDISAFFEMLLSDEYGFPLFKRLALFVATDYFDEYGKYAKQIMEKNPNIFCSIAYESELYDLLKSNVSSFDKEREFIENAIMFVPEYVDEEDMSKQIAHTRARFFMALSESEYFKSKMEQICKEANIPCNEIEEPRSRSVVTWTGSGKSFYSEDWFLDHSCAEIVSMFEELRDEDRFKPDQKSVEATSNVFRETVKKNHLKYISDIDAFLNAKFICVNQLICGLQDALLDKQEFSWEDLLKFVKSYVECDYFQKNKKDDGSAMPAYSNWVISSVARLISSGCRDEMHALNEKDFNLCEDVFSILFQNRQSDLPEKNDIQEVINTSYGAVIESYIMFSLRRARVNEKAGKEKGFRADVYDTLLKSETPEVFTFLGRYLINFVYLDEAWTFKKIEELRKYDPNRILWKGFFQGYLWGGGVYKVLYGPMQWHYKKAVETGHDYESVQEQVIEHAILEYLRHEADDPLGDKDNLLRFILDTNLYDTWKTVANVFWSRGCECIEKLEQKEDVEFYEKAKARVKEFWRWCFKEDTAKNRLDEKYDDYLADISLLICVFDSISDELLEQMKLAAVHVDRFHESTRFIEYLDKYTHSSDVEKVGKIFQEMLKNYVPPTYKQENIQSIVEKLYDKGFEGIADDICNTYGTKGVHFLRELWQKNNPM